MEAVVHLYMIVLLCSACTLTDLATATPVARVTDQTNAKPGPGIPDHTTANPDPGVPDPTVANPDPGVLDHPTSKPGTGVPDHTAATPTPVLPYPTDATLVPRVSDPTGASPVQRMPYPTVATLVPRALDLLDPTAATLVPHAPGLSDSTDATPVPRVPDPGFQTTLVQALREDILGTNWTIVLTEETIRAMREVHFGDPNYTPDFEQPAWTNGTVTAEDVESGRLEDSEILERVSSQLYIYEREVSAVKQDELAMVNSDPAEGGVLSEGGVVSEGDEASEGGVRGVYQLVVQVYGKTVYLRALLSQTAHLMGHELGSDHAHDPTEPASEYEMRCRALRVFLAYRAFLGELRGVFAALMDRELVTAARLGSPTSATPGKVTV